MMAMMLFSLCFLSYWRMPLGNEWYSVLGIGVLGLMGQIYLTIALKIEETNIVVPFKYTELIWVLFLGFLFFGEHYSWLPFLGMILIMVGMIMNVYLKDK